MSSEGWAGCCVGYAVSPPLSHLFSCFLCIYPTTFIGLRSVLSTSSCEGFPRFLRMIFPTANKVGWVKQSVPNISPWTILNAVNGRMATTDSTKSRVCASGSNFATPNTPAQRLATRAKGCDEFL